MLSAGQSYYREDELRHAHSIGDRRSLRERKVFHDYDRKNKVFLPPKMTFIPDWSYAKATQKTDRVALIGQAKSKGVS